MAIRYLKSFAVLIVILLAFFWPDFLNSLSKPDFTVDSRSLVAVNYLSEKDQVYEKLLEREKMLRMTSQILSVQEPEMQDAIIIAASGYGRVADYNLFISSGRNQFISVATIKNEGIDPNNFISEILQDKEYQRYATVYPNQQYNVYLKISHANSRVPTNVIINNKKYQINPTSDGNYRINDFWSSDSTSIGAKPENEEFMINEMVFFSKKVQFKNSLNRYLQGNDSSTIDQISHNMLRVNIPEKCFILVHSEPETFLKSHSILKNLPDTIPVNEYQHYQKNQPAEVNLLYPKKINIIAESGIYEAHNSDVEKNVSRYIVFSIMALIFTIIFYNSKKVIRIVKLIMKKFSKEIRSLTLVVGSRDKEIIIYAIILFLLFVLHNSPMFSDILTRTNLIAIAFLFVLFSIRFSLRYLILILLTFIVLVAGLSQLGMIEVAEKLGRLIFALIVMIFIVLIASDYKRKKGTAEVKKNQKM